MTPKLETHRLFRLFALPATAFLLAAMSAGCGGDSGGGSAPAGPPPTPPLTGSCAPSSSLGVLVQGGNVSAYVAKGNWGSDATGISVVPLEGSGITPTVVATANAANSCASNAKTGETVCVANNTDVYLLSGTSLTTTLTSGGSGVAGFSGGDCTNCSVAIDSVDDLAVIGLGTADGPGFQGLDLKGTPKFTPAYAVPSGEISEDPVVDPVHKLILSAAENGDYEIIKKGTSAAPAFYENTTFEAEYDSAAEDCSTGIAMATDEFTDNLLIADLTQATYTNGTPGSWTAPSQLQTFPEFASFTAGTCGISIAQGTHVGLATGEFGGNAFGAIQLPSTSGSGTPAVVDYVECTVPDDPTPETWDQGNDPHVVSAYQDPDTGDAMGVLGNGAGEPPTYLAVIDLTQLLNPSIVDRTGAHTCDPSVNLVTAGVVRFVAVP